MTIMPWTGPGPNPERPWGQPRRGGLFGASAQPRDMPMTANAQPMAPKKGFDWGKLIGVLGDSLSIAGGGAPQYVPNLIDQRNRRQAMDYAEQTYQRRRGDEMADWQARQEYERRNPKPVNNDTVADYQFIVQNLGEEAGKEFLKNKANPPQYRQGPDGQFYRIDVAPGQMPTFTQDDWDKGTPVNGGPTPSASGGFR